ncbi:MAG: hypothetical protein IJ043_07415 [Clostridia bacterium]|nr:hypothetical protein [Clostridia bacterium]
MKDNPEWDYDYFLAQQVLTGDQDAWGMLYVKAYQRVHNYVNSICIREYIRYLDPGDIVDIAFEKCYLKLGTFEGRSLFSTWVGGFCRRILRNEYRRHFVQSKYMLEIQNRYMAEVSGYNPEAILIRKEQCYLAFCSLDATRQSILTKEVIEKKKPNLANSKVTEALNILRVRFCSLYSQWDA